MLLCQLLRRQGMEVVVFATGANWDGHSIGRLEAAGVRFVLPPPILRRSRRLSVLYSTLIWVFRVPRRANSLYCIGSGLSPLWLHRLKPRNTLSIDHEIVGPPGPGSPAGKCVAGLDATVANSKRVLEAMQGLWPSKRMRVIPFLTSDRPMPPPVRPPRRPGDPLKVIYLGRLVAHKRPDVLVQRWQALSASAEMRQARLNVHGFDPEGKMLNKLRAFVTESGQTAQIHIHGEYSLAALPQILAASDLVVLPSLDEGLPLVLVEAMLHGVPFVATNAGGTEELGEDNPDVLVTGTEWPAFEQGLLRLAGKVRAGQTDSLRLHQWAESRYGYGRVSRQWLDCLQSPRAFFEFHD